MSVEVTPTGQACGARVTGIDLSAPLDDAQVAEIRSAWLEHHVLVFPEQEIRGSRARSSSTSTCGSRGCS